LYPCGLCASVSLYIRIGVMLTVHNLEAFDRNRLVVDLHTFVVEGLRNHLDEAATPNLPGREMPYSGEMNRKGILVENSETAEDRGRIDRIE
jgi:hypothetical protein